MARKKTNIRNGFTLTEMAAAIAVSSIVILGVAVVLVDAQRGWNDMYNRVYSDVVIDSHVARRVFDRIVRRASGQTIQVDETGNSVEVRYYQNEESISPDRYARLFFENGEFKVVHGLLNPKREASVDTVCANVSDCVFSQAGRSAQMVLTLNDGSQTIIATTSAVMHSK